MIQERKIPIELHFPCFCFRRRGYLNVSRTAHEPSAAHPIRTLGLTAMVNGPFIPLTSPSARALPADRR